VLTGQVVVSPDFTDYPEFVYRKNRVEYPMAGASSMVPELAPVVMLLRSMIERGETLIIEEPESHLHPDSQ
jgi:predicted ATPase